MEIVALTKIRMSKIELEEVTKQAFSMILYRTLVRSSILKVNS